MRAVVVGGGSWGTAFAALLAEQEHAVTLACRDPEQAAEIARTGRNPRYLSGFELEGIEAASLASVDPAAFDLVVFALPSGALEEAASELGGTTPAMILTKGLHPVDGRRPSQLVGERAVAVLSGPNHAEEIVGGLPAAAVVASTDAELAGRLQDAVHSARFRVYVNDDLVGVELCGAAKNVIALAVGAVDGLELGDNAKAALMSRGLAEMARLAEACGARPETFAGLAGMGDLVVTCWSRHSRNRRAGELVARGATVEEAALEIGQVVEGTTTAPALNALGQKLGIELPITEAVCGVLSGGRIEKLVSRLLARRPTRE